MQLILAITIFQKMFFFFLINNFDNAAMNYDKSFINTSLNIRNSCWCFTQILNYSSTNTNFDCGNVINNFNTNNTRITSHDKNSISEGDNDSIYIGKKCTNLKNDNQNLVTSKMVQTVNRQLILPILLFIYMSNN